jgi:peptidoglycan L-alanyl-D-glutamate endopeptidase CwlK
MIFSRDIALLHPILQPKCREFLNAAGDNAILTCTYRDNAAQAQLYNIGRAFGDKRRVVTHARLGQSKHNFLLDGKPASLAFDVVLMRNGKPVWKTTGPDGKAWHALGELGERLGLVWAWRWTTHKREFPHFEIAIPA